MPQADNSSRSIVPFQQDATLVAVVEMSQSSWLVAATVPGVDRQPRKKIVPDETALLRLLLRWRDEAIQSSRAIARITVASWRMVTFGEIPQGVVLRQAI